MVPWSGKRPPSQEGGVRPQQAVARCNALEASGQAGQEGGNPLLRAVGGASPGGVAQRQLRPSLAQAQHLGLAEDALDQHDTESAARPWCGRGRSSKLHSSLPLSSAKVLGSTELQHDGNGSVFNSIAQWRGKSLSEKLPSPLYSGERGWG